MDGVVSAVDSWWSINVLSTLDSAVDEVLMLSAVDSGWSSMLSAVDSWWSINELSAVDSWRSNVLSIVVVDDAISRKVSSWL